MKIVVCIKQVPATNEAKIDPETKRIIREGLNSILNPFDTYAIEEGVRIREKFGGEVIAISMGPEKAIEVLREALSLGVDKAILLSDKEFAGSDTWATSYALAKAIEKIGDVDLVICGKQAIDGDTAQVGPGIAAHLGWVQATYVMKVEDIQDGSIKVRRMREDGYDICEMNFPAVITVLKDINTPRIPSLKRRLAARQAQIPVWKPADIGADTDKIGLDGSPTRVVKTAPPPAKKNVAKRIEGTPKECAEALVRELRMRSII